MALEEQLDEAFNELNIPKDQQDSLKLYLELIKKRDVETYKHSIRVGLKGNEVAEFLHLDKKALFYSGLLHDVGKSLTDPASLKKKEDFNAKDISELRKHPSDGYRLLRDIHDFSAEIVLRHHQYSEDGYPKILPKSLIDFSKGSQTMIGYFSRVLSLIDFYDAITHRENDKFSPGNPRLPTKEESKKILLDLNVDQKYLINELYDKGIFN